MQRDPVEAEHIVAYGSRKLSDVERKYYSNELERLAAIWSVDDKFRHYVYGRHFTIVIDNAAISWMCNKQQLKRKFTRWILAFKDYMYVIRHSPALQNHIMDALSRNLIDSTAGCDLNPWMLLLQEDLRTAQ